MAKMRDQLNKDLDALRRLRDELDVQLHLGGAEFKEQWGKLERGWDHLEGRLKVLGRESEDIAEDMGATLQVLGDQLRDGYERIKKLL